MNAQIESLQTPLPSADVSIGTPVCARGALVSTLLPMAGVGRFSALAGKRANFPTFKFTNV